MFSVAYLLVSMHKVLEFHTSKALRKLKIYFTNTCVCWVYLWALYNVHTTISDSVKLLWIDAQKIFCKKLFGQT